MPEQSNLIKMEENMSEISVSFERALYQAVIRYKVANPGTLEARTEERRKEHEQLHDAGRNQEHGAADAAG